jgi:hypothetical protein
LSVINSIPETSDVEMPVEQQADSAVANPIVSLFSRQRRQKVFPTFPPDSDPYDEDQVSSVALVGLIFFASDFNYAK